MIDPTSPFFGLYQALRKALGGDDPQRFHVELDPKAQKLLRKMGPEEQTRVKKVIGKVHGTPLNVPNPHLTRMNENQHVQVGLDPAKRNGYTMGDYRVRLMGTLDVHKMTVFHVGTREDSKHTGRTSR
jgi:mRNA-degrading endonuclease RelE of RelBE toxin-antitoxin system